MPTENLTEFFLYVIPGFIAFGIFKARYPRKDRDTFFEVTESIIVGIVILSVIKWIDGNLLNYFLGSNITGLPGIRYSLALILTGLITGFLMIGQVELRSFLARKFKFCRFLSPGDQSVWLKVNNKYQDNWAIVFLDDNQTIYRGWISEFSNNPELENQEFLLIKAAKVDSNLKVEYLINGRGVYLNLRDIKRIEFVSGSK